MITTKNSQLGTTVSLRTATFTVDYFKPKTHAKKGQSMTIKSGAQKKAYKLTGPALRNVQKVLAAANR